jgi:hypothetical protein
MEKSYLDSALRVAREFGDEVMVLSLLQAGAQFTPNHFERVGLTIFFSDCLVIRNLPRTNKFSPFSRIRIHKW